MYGIISNADRTITERKAEIVARLDQMRANGWKELESMTGDELAALHDEVDEANVILNDLDPNPHNRIRFDAYAAIKAERLKRSRAAWDRQQKQQTRRDNINRAVNNIREAIELIDVANGIPDCSRQVQEPPTIDVANATDIQLQTAREECWKIANLEPSTAEDDAKLIQLLKTPASKAVSNGLREHGQEYEARQAQARELRESIIAEQERRDAVRAAEEEALRPKTLLERIEQLESQLAEKEDK